MPQVGVVLDQQVVSRPTQELAEAARRIEALGFESIWLLDSFSYDIYLTASFILQNTSTIKVGTGIATVHSRDAMATAQARDALARFYPGRFILGLGASNEWIVKMRGGEWVPPVPKMTAYLEALANTQLAHGKVDSPPPLHIAAHAPGLQNLALKHAQGIITWILPVASIRKSRAHVGPGLEITANFPCVVCDDPAEARSVARQFLSFYLGIDYYQRAYAAAGFEPADFENGGSDGLIDAIVAWGSPDKIKQRVSEYEAAGATRVVLSPVRAAAKAPAASGIEGLEREWQADADLESLERLAPVLL